jgi:hypothetical protein
MPTYEQNAESFEKILMDFGENPDPTFTEADTRSKIIDRILRESLGWPETGPFIRREEHIHEGYIDYTLQSGENFLIVEAKRTGKSFSLPKTFSLKMYLSVKNLLLKQGDIRLMYDQVIRYAHERGVPYCALTDGTQWLIFPGVRVDNIHIRRSKVILFNGFAEIRTNFLDFWNLLSYESVALDSLKRNIIDEYIPIEPSYLFNAEGRINIPYDRNYLSLPLTDILPRYFGDLHGDPTHTDMLQECFVKESPVFETIYELDLLVVDEKPSKTLTSKGPVLHFYSLPQVSQKLEGLINSFITDKRFKYYQVLLGRVGIGKSTFIAYFFNIYRNDLTKDHYTLYIDYRDISESTDLEEFFNNSLWEMLNNHHRFKELVSDEILRDIYRNDIDLLANGPLKRLRVSQPDRFEDEISIYLAKQFYDKTNFIKRLSRYIVNEQKGRFILIFDNVDQLPVDLQEKVISHAYSKAGEYNAFTILTMWEETYYSSKRSGRILSTIRTVPLQITRQSITSVLIKRLVYLIKQIGNANESLALLDEKVCSKELFCKFLDLILRSLVVKNRRVRMFLEGVALGNIRKALETFSSFLTAGSLETPKILGEMESNDEYLVPDHEFVKSIMLGSKRYYSEKTSDVVNLFAIGDMERPSHFTRLRLLQWLYERRHESTPFGTGYMHVRDAQIYFNQLGVSTKDLVTSIKRLIENSIIEDDLRSQKFSEAAQAIRITATGRYYLNHLFRMFAYIDLVMQDTPFFDQYSFMEIANLCESTDMAIRFTRCDLFLNYLQDQEEEELMILEKIGKEVTWRKNFVGIMKESLEKTKEFIRSKGYI